MRIGILGGSFDPIHCGHLSIAEEVRVKLHLDKVVFVPAYNSPHKNGCFLSPITRYKLIERAIKSNPFFTISAFEIHRKDKSYTCDTLPQLEKIYKESQFYVIIGADELQQFTKWKNYQWLLAKYKFVVVNRPKYSLTKVKKTIRERVKIIKIPGINISSSKIRQRIRNGQSIKYLVPECVEKYLFR